jgi:hypothetical protein
MLKNTLKSLFARGSDAPRAPDRHAPGRPFYAYVAPVEAPRRVDPDVPGYSVQASLRLRVLMPAREIARDAEIWTVPLEVAASADPEGALGGMPAAWIIGKMPSGFVAHQADAVARLLANIERWRRSVPVVADVSDDYAAIGRTLGSTFLEEYQRRLVSLCRVTVPCAALREALMRYPGADIEVVEDPYERTEPGAPGLGRLDGPLAMCWYGFIGPLNANVLEAATLRLAVALRGRPVRLEMLTSEERAPLIATIEAAARKVNPDFEVVYLEWSREAAAEAVDRASFVFLPQDTTDPWGRVKSHNRLVEAIRGGRLALASPIPSYVELADFAWVNEDLAAGVQWAIDHPEEALARIKAGQAYVERRFAPAAVAARWKAVLGLPSPVPAARLNLGCGDKILEGYVNVDVAPSRAGRKPDVLCDLRRLEPFADDSAEEVLAVHVVEHFWRWEVLDVLKEWVRVLRPGGRMVLECPNLLTACEELLRNPEAAAGTGQEAQRTMWVFYGDPRWQDPLMTHRWNYTPQSLAALMRDAGLVNVRQEPAQYKLREPRDMRVVGEKPAA